MLCSAHGREFFHLFPELSNSGCLPGRAGGTPYGSSRSAQMDLLTAAGSITGPDPDPVANNNFDSLEIQVILPGVEWIIPFFHNSPQFESGIAVANLSASDSHLLLRAFLEKGVPPLPLNPRSYLLPRRRQSTLLPREIFGEWSDSSAAWVRIRRIVSSSPASFKSLDAVPWMVQLLLLNGFSRPSSRESSRAPGPIECCPQQPISAQPPAGGRMILERNL